MARRTGSGQTAADQIRQDARGQFAKSGHGRRHNGITNAAPRVIAGDEDATFDTDPGEKDRKGKQRDH